MDRRPKTPGELLNNLQDMKIKLNTYIPMATDPNRSEFNALEAIIKPKDVYDYTDFSRMPSNYIISDYNNNSYVKNMYGVLASISKNHIVFSLPESTTAVNVYIANVTNITTGTISILSASGSYITVNQDLTAQLAAITDWSDKYVYNVTNDCIAKISLYTNPSAFNFEETIDGFFNIGDQIHVVSKIIDANQPYWRGVPVQSIPTKTSIQKTSAQIDNNSTNISFNGVVTLGNATSLTLSIYAGATKVGHFNEANTWTHSTSVGSAADFSIRCTGNGSFSISSGSIVLYDGTNISMPEISFTDTDINIIPDTNNNWYFGTSFPTTTINIYSFYQNTINQNDYIRKSYYNKKNYTYLYSDNFIILKDEYLYTTDNMLTRDTGYDTIRVSNTTPIPGADFLTDLLVRNIEDLDDYQSYGSVLITDFTFYSEDTYEAVTGLFTGVSTALDSFTFTAVADDKYYYATFYTGYVWKIKNSTGAKIANNDTLIKEAVIPLKNMPADLLNIVNSDGNIISLGDAIKGKMERKFPIIIDSDWISFGYTHPFIIKNNNSPIFQVDASGNIISSGDFLLTGNMTINGITNINNNMDVNGDIIISGDVYNANGEIIISQSGAAYDTFTKLSALANTRYYNEEEKVFSKQLPEIDGANFGGIWSNVATLSVAKERLAGFSLNSYGYAAGGSTGSRTGVVEKYNNAVDTWATVDTLNTPRYGLAGFSLNNYGYTAGGYTTVINNTTEKYNDVTDAWATVDTLNTSRQSLVGFTSNNYGYVAGGTTGSPSAIVEKYNDILDIWIAVYSIGTARYSPGVFSLNNVGFICGGWATGESDVVEKYDDFNDYWIVATSLTSSKYGMSYFSILNYGYIAGGIDSTDVSVAQKYNDLSDTWFTIESINSARHDFTGFSIDNDGYIFGGIVSSIRKDIVEKYSIYKNYYYLGKFYTSANAPLKIMAGHSVNTQFNCDSIDELRKSYLDRISFTYRTSPSMSWVSGETNSDILDISSAIPVSGEYIYEFGINIPEQCNGKYYFYGIQNSFWTVSTTGCNFTSVHKMAAFSLDGYGYTAGGDFLGTPGKPSQKYNDVQNLWISISNLNTANSFNAGFSLNGYGYTTGGGSVGTDVERYNSISNSWLTVDTITSRLGLSDFNLNGYGYAAGGNNGAAMSTTEKYSDMLNNWITVDTLNYARYYLSSFSLNSFGYTVGGDTGVYAAYLERYNDISNSWDNVTGLSTARKTLAGFMLNGYGYATGGEKSGTVIANENEEYNDKTNSWANRTTLNTARKDLSAFSLHGYGYVVGGGIGVYGTNYVEKYSNQIISDRITGFSVKIIEGI